MLKWILALAVLAIIVVVVLGVVGAVYYFYFYLPKQPVGPLPAEALIFPAQASVVGGLDLRQLRTTPLAQRILAQDQVGEGLKEVQTKIGVRLDKDVDWVGVCSWPRGGQENGGLGLVKGRFDLARLSAMIEKEESSVKKKTYQGATVYQLQDASWALVDAQTLLVGTPADVDLALTARAEGQQPLRANSDLVGRLKQLSGSPTLWILATGKSMGLVKTAFDQRASGVFSMGFPQRYG